MPTTAFSLPAPPAGPDPGLVVVARLLDLADAAERAGLPERARRARRIAGLLLGAPGARPDGGPHRP